jgi:metallophosphoesterase (TIGR00282 family)
MNLLYFGDVMGRAGRAAIADRLPGIRKRLSIDFVIVNGENAAGGFGITKKICGEFYDAGVDAITTGNHVWDQDEIVTYIDSEPRLLRPNNYPPGTPGRGIGGFETAGGTSVFVIQIMCRLFMDALDDPFASLATALETVSLGGNVGAIVVDLHGEATSEKMALAHFVDGRVSLAVGSHSHVPTADTQVLRSGTAYQTDAGMCGDYDSVIGMEKETAVERFVTKMRGRRLSPATGEATLCGVYVETDERTGLARTAAPLRIGGRLRPHWPGS